MGGPRLLVDHHHLDRQRWPLRRRHWSQTIVAAWHVLLYSGFRPVRHCINPLVFDRLKSGAGLGGGHHDVTDHGHGQ